MLRPARPIWGRRVWRLGNGYADAAAFRSAASEGEFGIDPDAAHTVLNKIRACKDAVESLLQRAHSMGVPPRLGANPVGHAIAAKYAERADGGTASYAQALRNLHNQYSDAEQGILTAMRHYDEFDQEAADTFRGKI